MNESPESAAGAGRRTRPLLWLGAGLPLLPILVGVLLNSGSAPAPTGLRPLAQSPPRSAGTGLPPGRGALVALVERRTIMRSAPGGPPLHPIGPRTEFGSATALWVTSTRGRWLGVVSPLAGNGRLGWILRGSVSLTRVDWELRVSLSARRLTVLQGGRPVQRYTVAIGQPGAPTPTGRFAVTDRLFTGDPAGPYGCCILATSALSPHAIQGWNGGNRIAIHSTPDPATIGQPVSHGCLRLTLAEGRWLLNHVPIGTPTLIRS